MHHSALPSSSRKIKVCFLKPETVQTDGALKVLQGVVEELHDDIEITVVSVYGDSSNENLSEFATATSLLPEATRLSTSLLKALWRFRKLVRKERFDTVISVGSSTALHAAFGTIGLNTTAIMWEHSNLLAEDGNSTLRKIGATTSWRIICLTEDDRRRYIAKFGLSADGVRVISNWMDPDLIQPGAYKSDSRKILSFGRLVPIKGYDLLLEVAEKLLSIGCDFSWDIFGEGPLYDELESEIQKKGLKNVVTLCGSDPEITGKIGDYGLVVMTSRQEGLPISLLEAQAKHVPIVSFDIPTGPGEIIESGSNGYLIPFPDIDAMAQTIADLLPNTNEKERLSANALLAIKKFDKEAITQNWRGLFEEIASNRRGY